MKSYSFMQTLCLVAALSLAGATLPLVAQPGNGNAYGNGNGNGNAYGNGNGNAYGKYKDKFKDGLSSPPAPEIAQTIAADAGGAPDQYAYYSENLARTLSNLTPAQRARVFTD